MVVSRVVLECAQVEFLGALLVLHALLEEDGVLEERVGVLVVGRDGAAVVLVGERRVADNVGRVGELAQHALVARVVAQGLLELFDRHTAEARLVEAAVALARLALEHVALGEGDDVHVPHRDAQLLEVRDVERLRRVEGLAVGRELLLGLGREANVRHLDEAAEEERHVVVGQHALELRARVVLGARERHRVVLEQLRLDGALPVLERLVRVLEHEIKVLHDECAVLVLERQLELSHQRAHLVAQVVLLHSCNHLDQQQMRDGLARHALAYDTQVSHVDALVVHRFLEVKVGIELDCVESVRKRRDRRLEQITRRFLDLANMLVAIVLRHESTVRIGAQRYPILADKFWS